MYTLISKTSQTISNPLVEYLNSYDHFPLVFAFLLGLVGSVAPCQLTGNVSAITFYGNRTIQSKNTFVETIFFILGKITVFSLIGLFSWIFGQSFETKMTVYFPIFRQAIGPLMIITGLVLIGIFKLRLLNRLMSHIPVVFKKGKLGSFMLGASFSIAFCPTMFVLFFVWLMPTVISTSYGFILPAVFGVSTAIPLILIFFLIWFFDAKRIIMRIGMKAGRIIQVVTGALLLIIGIVDTITFWGI
ncbi:urease accessory protein UreH domain-containing protein [Rummeliibacillus stabekisii]|uniref:urease accessory protein UreH domain-containing protein n=1 Tax=Rummeliibacillus stabekisii TaxID=241244 RepID=UPI0037242B40